MREKKKLLRSIVPLFLSGALISIYLIIAFTVLTTVRIEANKDAALAKYEAYQEEQKIKKEKNKSTSEENVKVTEKQALNDGIHTTSEQQTRNEMEDLMRKISSETAGSDPR